MTPAAEALMRAIAEHRTRSPELRLVVEMARAALLAEGVEVDSAPPPPEGDPRSRKAINQAAYRRRRQVQPGNALPLDGAHAGNALPGVTGHVTGHVTGSAPPDPPETLSDLVDLSPSERESETRVRTEAVTGGVTGHVTGPVTGSVTGLVTVTRLVTPSTVRALELAEPLPETLREAAKIASVQDIDGAWLKFCGHYAGQAIHIQGAWQKWCVNEAKHERTERERRRKLEEKNEPPPREGPAVREERRRRDQAHADAVRHAAPPPAELLETVGLRPRKAAT